MSSGRAASRVLSPRVASGVMAGLAATAAVALLPPAVASASQPLANRPLPRSVASACAAHWGGLDESARCIAAATSAIDAARASEGVGPVVLPAGFATLDPAQQLLVVTNAERTARGVAPFTGLTDVMDGAAQAGAESDLDPSGFGVAGLASWGANVAEGYDNPLLAEYEWMYDDGPGGPNTACGSAGGSGCWGHRRNILQAYGGPAGARLVLGAAWAAPSRGGGTAFATLAGSTTGAQALSYAAPGAGPPPPQVPDAAASFHGSMGGHALSAPVVGIAATPDGRGGAGGSVYRAAPAGPPGDPAPAGSPGSRGGSGPAGTSASATLPVGGPPGPWKLAFDSTFSGSQLDTSKWSTCYPWGDCTNRGNDELEWYTPANIQVGGGSLSLVAERQPVQTRYGPFPYTSGLIQSDGHFDFTYGYAEMRAWLPAGKGFWPAFWLLPADQSWPPEIDVMEAAGAVTNDVSLTFHWPPNAQDGSDFEGPDFTAGWHTFAVDWEPGHITWYVDGVARKTFSQSAVVPSKPMYLIANLAIDGTDPPSASTPFPSTMRISYIRVWQH
ncbi:MAG: family 16 glycosylhydrolase [Acidimicrobiales bacterium]